METMMPTRATDENLLRRAQAGDRPAYGELARRYRERLEALAGSLMSPALRRVVAVDDIVQESLARGLASIESFTWRGEGSLLRWLGTIARNVIAQAARRDLKNAPVELKIEPSASVVSPSRQLRREERLQRLERALTELSDDQREVISLARIDGLSASEIAARTGRSETAVRQSLSRGLRALRTSFGDTASLGLPPRPLSAETDIRPDEGTR